MKWIIGLSLCVAFWGTIAQSSSGGTDCLTEDGMDFWCEDQFFFPNTGGGGTYMHFNCPVGVCSPVVTAPMPTPIPLPEPTPLPYVYNPTPNFNTVVNCPQDGPGNCPCPPEGNGMDWCPPSITAATPTPTPPPTAPIVSVQIICPDDGPNLCPCPAEGNGTPWCPGSTKPPKPQSSTTCPFPNWGYKGDVCIRSCGSLGGTMSFDDACSNHGAYEVGKAYDVAYCCRPNGTGTPPDGNTGGTTNPTYTTGVNCSAADVGARADCPCPTGGDPNNPRCPTSSTSTSSTPTPTPGGTGRVIEVTVPQGQVPVWTITRGTPESLAKKFAYFVGMGPLTENCSVETFVDRKVQCRINKGMALVDLGVSLVGGAVDKIVGIAEKVSMRFLAREAMEEAAKKVEEKMMNRTLGTCAGAACQMSIAAVQNGWDYSITRIAISRSNTMPSLIDNPLNYTGHAITQITDPVTGVRVYASWGKVYNSIDDLVADHGFSGYINRESMNLSDYINFSVDHYQVIESPASAIDLMKKRLGQ